MEGEEGKEGEQITLGQACTCSVGPRQGFPTSGLGDIAPAKRLGKGDTHRSGKVEARKALLGP